MNPSGHYELEQASSPEDWEALHNLRRSELDFGHFEEESFVDQGLSETLLLRLTH